MIVRNLLKKLAKSPQVQPKYFFSSPTDVQDLDIRTPWAQRPGIGGVRNVTLIPGGGIGPELTKQVQKVFEAAHCPIQWDVIDNFDISNKDHVKRLKKNNCVVIGVLSGDKKTNYLINTRVGNELGVFANLIPARTIPNIKTRHRNVDVTVIRECTEGEYSGIEHEIYPGVISSAKVITKDASLRIAEYAFEFAFLSGRKKVTAVHKANIMKLCDGVFLEATREVAKKYPMMKYDEIIIDNCCMQMVKNPWQFDVMVMPNLYGSIIGNTAAGITGGPGLTPGASVGKDHVIFQQGTKHTGADISGKGVANPTAIILSSIIMLKHMGLPKFAWDIEQALSHVYRDTNIRTKDLGGTATCDEFTEAVISNLGK